MKCLKCDKKLRAKYVDFDYSDTCGIPGTNLSNIKQYTCEKCDETYHDLGSIDEINQMISDILLNQKELNRNQIKFIRTHIFDMTYFQFGELTEINPQTIKRLEGHTLDLTKKDSQKIQNALFAKTQRPKVIMGC